MRADIEKIIDAGNHAPSGDNCQPWRFEVKENKIFLFLLKDRDTSLYSWGDRASIIANGAAVENMEITAGKLGYSARIETFPDAGQPLLLAAITLEKSTPKADELYASIFARTTNRKPYKKLALTQEQLTDFQNSASQTNAQIKILADDSKKKQLGEIAALNEKVLFSNFPMPHHFFLQPHKLGLGARAQASVGILRKNPGNPRPGNAGLQTGKKLEVYGNP